jgi:TetR/AcrR family transcriptional regulator, fatty acid metabolism regulator protein
MRSNLNQRGQTLSFIEQARRQQLVEALIAGVAEEGYAGASLAKVAERAKISKSVVLYHFGGKNDLIETAVAQIYDEIWRFIKPRFEAETTARGKLLTYVASELAFLEQNRPRLLALSYILINHRDDRGRLQLREGAEAIYLKVVGALLEEGQKNGEFRPFAIAPMATTLMHAINGALGRWVEDPTMSLAEYGRELATIFDLATQNSPSGSAVRRTAR